MASFTDIVAFCVTIAVFIGAIYGVKYVSGQVSTSIQTAKESLRDRGLTISDKGMSVRTTGRYSREDYVDATQRGLMKAMGASSFATADNVDGKTTSHSVLDNTPDGGLKFSMPALNRQLSEASILSNSSGSDKEKKKSRFRLRKKSSA